MVESMGKVGMRISDAQMLAETVISNLQKRVGTEGVIYEDAYQAAKHMKKMLGPNSENAITEEKLSYYEAAMKNAAYRVRIRFGRNKKGHWIRYSCRKADAARGKTLDSGEVHGKDFLKAREALAAAMPTFCTAIKAPAPVAQPTPQQPGQPPSWLQKSRAKKKPPRDWAPPPSRD
jgi:hypothetical protein